MVCDDTLPLGVNDRDCEGPEPRDEYGRTRAEQCEEERLEHLAEIERDGG